MISMKLGYPCLYVTVVPDGDRLGHVCCDDPLVQGHDTKFEDALKILMAAGLSESRRLGRASWGDAEDRAMAHKLALLACDQKTEQAEALIDQMIGETRVLVERHWPEIETLAQRLLAEGKVNFLGSDAGAP